jgi:hypothetical protein
MKTVPTGALILQEIILVFKREKLHMPIQLTMITHLGIHRVSRHFKVGNGSKLK